MAQSRPQRQRRPRRAGSATGILRRIDARFAWLRGIVGGALVLAATIATLPDPMAPFLGGGRLERLWVICGPGGALPSSLPGQNGPGERQHSSGLCALCVAAHGGGSVAPLPEAPVLAAPAPGVFARLHAAPAPIDGRPSVVLPPSCGPPQA